MTPARALRPLAWLAVLLAGCQPPPRPGQAPPEGPPAALPPAAPSPGGSPFAGTWLPVPPRQHAPWAPRARDLPEKLVGAAAALFPQGLADPRGLAYHEIEITTGSVWSGAGAPTKTHGWVLPAEEGAPQRFGVAWNGLVYPVASVGKPADLRADVAAMVKADEAMRAEHARQNPDSEFYRFRHAWAEEQSASHESLLPIKAALLLRLGEDKLARDVWSAWTAGMRKDTNDDATHLGDPYLMLAGDWVWALFDRAVCAHMRGDDALARASATALGALEKSVEAEADRRGFPRRGRGDEAGRHFEFLDALPALRADQDRRAKEAAAPGAGAPGAPGADPAARVAALVERLDEIDARQWGQPGGVDLGSHATVQALVREGEAAVEPLLAVLESDTRLTRSVHFWRDFAHHRSILGVHEAAYVALAGILNASFFGAASTGDDLSARGLEGRREVAAKIRGYWAKWKSVPLEERWYRILADDASPPAQWLEAARNITQPAHVTVIPGSMAFTTSVTSTAPSGPPVLRGEALRKKAGPSVAELMAKRVDDLAARPIAGTNSPLDGGCTMAHFLAAWDARAAVPALKRQVRRARDAMGPRRDPRSLETSTASRCIADLTLGRVAGADQKALDEYGDWIRGVAPDEVDWYVKEIFEPMWRNPDHPAIARAAEVLFGKAGSPWTKLTGQGSLSDLLETPMVRVEAFKKVVVRELASQKTVGWLEVRSKEQFHYQLDAGSSGGSSITQGDPLAPPPGTTHDLRVCDMVAWKLGSQQGAPAFQVYWGKAKRDEALKAMKAFVEAQ